MWKSELVPGNCLVLLTGEVPVRYRISNRDGNLLKLLDAQGGYHQLPLSAVASLLAAGKARIEKPQD